MSYSIILLDWDGCMANTLPHWMQACQETLAEFGVDNLSRQDIAEQFFGWHGEVDRYGLDVEAFWESVRAKINANYADVELHDGVIEVLSRLSDKGKQMAVVSSSMRVLLGAAVEKQRVNDFVQFYLGAEDVQEQKPSPQAVDIALERLNGRKEEAILVGDSKYDLGMGTNAGIATVLHYPSVNENFYELETLKTYNPSFVIRSFTELERIVG